MFFSMLISPQSPAVVRAGGFYQKFQISNFKLKMKNGASLILNFSFEI